MKVKPNMKMKVKLTRIPLPFCCLVAALVFATSTAAAWGAVDDSPELGQWQPLFNGKNLDGWYVVIGDKKSDDPNRLVQVHDGMVHMYKDAPADSEQPFGYIATDKEYTDFDLRLEYQWGVKRFAPRARAPRDSGILYCVVGKDGVWPRCVECQIWEGDVGDTYAVYTRVTAPVDPATKNQPVYLSPEAGGIPHIVGDANSIGRVGRNPMNEHEGWNTIEVVVRNGAATHIVNGRTVNEVTKAEELVDNTWVPLRKGRIALQLEGAEIFYRNIQIKTAIPAAEQRQVERWGIFEVELKGPAEGNPFIDVNLSAEFTSGGKTISVAGFYDGEGKYIVRIMPTELGTYQYVTRSNVKELDGQKGQFECVKPLAGNHGPVGVKDTYHFAYADATPYYQFGTTCYAWIHQSEELQQQTLKTLATAPFNKIRMCVFPKNYTYNKNEPALFAFEKNADGKFDFTRFSPVFFHHLEQRVRDLMDLGIEADLILFHPYDEGRWGFDRMTPETDRRYLRYIVARLSAFRNVWWSMANEYDFMGKKKPTDWDDFFQIVQQADTYNHFRGVHNGSKWYDHTKPWVTHASIQSGDLQDAKEWRKRYKKPIIDDECQYEGNIREPWGNLTAQELVHRFWLGTVVGCYVGHGETYIHPEDILWWSKGGVLHGESPARIAFLRKLVEDGPAVGLEPIEGSWEWDVYAGGRKGPDYYLCYFGTHQPKVAELPLPSTGQYKVEVIDTWNMTLTPIEGTFTSKKPIPLPGKPYLALRAQKMTQ